MSFDRSRLDAVLAWFETLSPASLAQIDDIYAQHARFKDPHNRLQGVDEIRRLYAHMFAQLDAPRFVIESRLVEGARAFVTWRFHFGLRGRALEIRGGTLFQFDATGRIAVHEDFWDAAQELYEQLPWIGVLMRVLRRRLALPPQPVGN